MAGQATGRLAERAGVCAASLLRLIAMFLVLGAIDALVSLPLSFYGGFVLEHRFDLSRLTLARWAWRYLKRNLLAGGLGLAWSRAVCDHLDHGAAVVAAAAGRFSWWASSSASSCRC